MALLGLSLLPPAAVAAPVCRTERVARIALDQERHLAMVPVTLNGAAAWMGIDTGAQNTLLAADAAQRLGLPSDRTRRTNVLSGAGATLVQNIRLHDMQVGDVMFSDLSVAAVMLPQPEGVRRWADGLIGADILSDYDVEIDFIAGTFSLWQVSGCARLPPPWPGEIAAVPLTLTRTRRPTLPVQIDGQTVTALFDSGSDRERLSHTAALRIGVTDAMLARDPDTIGTAAGGSARPMRLHRFRTLSIGNDGMTAPVLEVGSLTEAEADMLLGLDYMRGRRFWISYATRTLFIQRAPH